MLRQLSSYSYWGAALNLFVGGWAAGQSQGLSQSGERSAFGITLFLTASYLSFALIHYLAAKAVIERRSPRLIYASAIVALFGGITVFITMLAFQVLGRPSVKAAFSGHSE